MRASGVDLRGLGESGDFQPIGPIAIAGLGGLLPEGHPFEGGYLRVIRKVRGCGRFGTFDLDRLRGAVGLRSGRFVVLLRARLLLRLPSGMEGDDVPDADLLALVLELLAQVVTAGLCQALCVNQTAALGGPVAERLRRDSGGLCNRR